MCGLGFAKGKSPISSFSFHDLAQIWSNPTKEKPDVLRKWHFVPRSDLPAPSAPAALGQQVKASDPRFNCDAKTG
jgi:hypothetical protein